ncbi:Chemotactic transducer-related protein [hydrothermal vent metagenome]|uniref:Chemotactic transducer-related protein n=1 Tax=hydrothermal vent metagenome TaxID=652676 RepID=A0A1W1EHN5_9ZZZZ
MECSGFIVSKDGSSIIFSGDTFKNSNLWSIINRDKSIKAVIIDVSFPNRFQEVSRVSKHLSPTHLKDELKLLKRDDIEIYIYHLKLEFKEEITKELLDIGIKKENILNDYTEISYSNGKFIDNNKECTIEDKIKKLNKIGLALSSENELPILLEMIVEASRELTNCDGGTLYLKDDNGLNFHIVQTKSLNIFMGGSKEEINWKPLPIYLDNGEPNRKMIAVCSVLDDRVINITDIYQNNEFSFDGAKEFDISNNYKSKSNLTIPLKNYENEIIGVLQLLNKLDNNKNIVAFDSVDEEIISSLASQAAISITNTNLILDFEKMIESFLHSILYAIKETSPHTASHIGKMVDLTNMIVDEIDRDKSIFKDKNFSNLDKKIINISALLHDVGKIATPDIILNKSTKLEGIFDGIDIINSRFNSIKKSLEIAYLKNIISKDEFDNRVVELDNDFETLKQFNTGGEFLAQDKIDYIQDMAKTPIIIDSQKHYRLTPQEASLLSIAKGTLSKNEREIINRHAIITQNILKKLHLPKKYKEIPQISGNHHEKLNGKGYPNGLKGDEITFEARVLAVADIFEAITSKNRPYRKPNSLTTSMKILNFMVKDGEIDASIVKFLEKSGLNLRYAKKYNIEI